MTRSVASRRFALSAVGAVTLACLAFACTSTSTGTGSPANGNGNTSTSSTEPLAANCNARCEVKATECNSPDPSETCDALCGMRMTEAQATCLENSSCQDLTSSGDLPCGISANGSGSSSGGTSSGSSTSSSSSSSSGSTSSSSGSASAGDPPGSPCGAKNGGVNDCAPVGCKCNDGSSTLPASVCTNGSCAGKSDFCPDACDSKGGWSGK